MRVSNVILTSFLFLLFVFSIAVYQSYRQYEELTQKNHVADHSAEIVSISNEFLQIFHDLTYVLRDELPLGGEAMIKNADSSILVADKALTQLTFLVDVDSDQQLVLEDIKQRWKFWQTEFARPLLDSKKHAIASDSGRAAFVSFYKSKLSHQPTATAQRSFQVRFARLMNAELQFHGPNKWSSAFAEDSMFRFLLPWAIAVVVGISIALYVTYHISLRIKKISSAIQNLAIAKYNLDVADERDSEFGEVIQELRIVAKILESNTATIKRQKEDLDQFILLVSHDIKTPLRGISDALTYIGEDHDRDLQNGTVQYLETIKNSVNRIDVQLQQILKYVRNKTEATVNEYVHIGALLDEIMEHCVEPREGITLIKGHDLPLLNTDRAALRQVLANLVANAFKHHDKARGTVRVYHKNKGEFVEFFVEDDGPGIPVTYHDKIFRIFQTIKSSRGTAGVGLSIVKRITSERNLDVNIISEPGKGSIFSFTWPR